MSSTKMSQDAKKDEFRKYLEKAGVLELLTKSLVQLYEEPEKPSDALSYLKKTVGGSDGDKSEIEKLKIENEELKAKIAELEASQTSLQAKVSALEAQPAAADAPQATPQMEVASEAPETAMAAPVAEEKSVTEEPVVPLTEEVKPAEAQATKDAAAEVEEPMETEPGVTVPAVSETSDADIAVPAAPKDVAVEESSATTVEPEKPE